MNSYYSILYCPISPYTDERISVALIGLSGEKVFVKSSQEKLKATKDLIPDEAFRLLKMSLRNIEVFLLGKLADANENPLALFSVPTVGTAPLAYLDYLNVYSNNLLTFSKPVPIDVVMNEEVFNRLYEKYIYAHAGTEAKRILLSETIKPRLKPLIKEHVNLDYELTIKDFKSLVVPTKVWFIGVNDRDVTGEIFDFGKSIPYLENDIREHLFLLNSLRASKKNYDAKHFVLYDEPTNEVAKNMWEQIKEIKYISFVNKKETELIPEYLKAHHVKPFDMMSYTSLS